MPMAIKVKAMGKPKKMTKMKMPNMRRAMMGSLMMMLSVRVL
jgi:hypothetical protein